MSTSYTFSDTVNTGTLDLIIMATNQAIPNIGITAPAPNARVMENTALALTGTVSNTGTANALSGTLSGTGVLSVTNLTAPPIAVTAGNFVAISGSLNTGNTLGSGTFAVTVMDGSASPTFATATGTVDVLQNRVLSPLEPLPSASCIAGASISGTTGLQSTGIDTQNTRVTIINTSGTAATDANGISVVLSNPSGIFKGSLSQTGTLTGAIASAGTYNGSVTLSTTSAEVGGPLLGEVDGTFGVNYSVSVFSGHATWASNVGSSWGTNGNWGDTASNDIMGLARPVFRARRATATRHSSATCPARPWRPPSV